MKLILFRIFSIFFLVVSFSLVGFALPQETYAQWCSGDGVVCWQEQKCSCADVSLCQDGLCDWEFTDPINVGCGTYPNCSLISSYILDALDCKKWTGSCINVAPPSSSCGDGSCNGDENCSTCEADCGACPPGGTTCESNGNTCMAPAVNCGIYGMVGASGTCDGGDICCTTSTWTGCSYPSTPLGCKGVGEAAPYPPGVCTDGPKAGQPCTWVSSCDWVGECKWTFECCDTLEFNTDIWQCDCACEKQCTPRCGQDDGCGGTCSNNDNGAPSCPVITPTSGGTVNINPLTNLVTVSWSDNKADRYNVQVYPTSTTPGCPPLNPDAFCSSYQTARSFSFSPDPDINQYTVRVQPINTTCGTDAGTWCESSFTITAEIPVNFYLDNTASCIPSAPVDPGTGSALGGEGQYGSYTGTITGTTGTITLPYWTGATADNIITLTPGLVPGESYTYNCDNSCHPGCQYTGISSPLAAPATALNFYLVEIDLSHSGWWQSIGGMAYAQQSVGDAVVDPIPTTTCTDDPDCTPAIITQDQCATNPDCESDVLTSGIVMTGGGSIDSSDEVDNQTGYISERDNQAYIRGSITTKIKENYDYFYRQYSMGSTNNTFPGDANDATKPPALTADQKPYYRSGNLIINNNAWQVTADEQIVIFVDGDLIIDDSTGIEQLITVEKGGFLAFMVSGDIIFTANVGNSDLTNTATNVEGVYIANGSITIESRGEAAGGDFTFIGAGTFVGWNGVNLNRDFSDGGTRKAENNTKAVERFIYRPDFIQNIPEEMKKPNYVWQETN